MSQVWISAVDGSDMVRADAIVILRMDKTGRLTAQLRDEPRINVTLLAGSAHGARPPADFHRRLIRKITELADSSGAQLIHAERANGEWQWDSEPI